MVDRRQRLGEVLPLVRPIIDMVREGGDGALRDLTLKFDGVRPKGLRVPPPLLAEAWRGLPSNLKRALRFARKNIEAFHGLQVPRDLQTYVGDDPSFGRLGLRCLPLRRVGVYVPGGPRGYPSSVLMACIPATLARVGEIALCSPPQGDGLPAPTTLAAAHLCGVEEVYGVGGAQAIAALALGTATIRPVEKIVGPGNRFVTAAKYLLRDAVAIDALAGPSEVVVVADGGAYAEAVAWDLLAQAEHGPDAFVLLLTSSTRLALAVVRAVSRALAADPGAAGAAAALERQEYVLLTGNLGEALAFADDLAPEHLILHVAEPGENLDKVRRASAVFLGGGTPVSFGDYCLGTNHILPTMGTARRSSPLTVLDFVRWQSWAELTPAGYAALAGPTEALAEAEGFLAHARAVAERRGDS